MAQFVVSGPAWWRALVIAFATALAYAGVAAAALMLAGPPAFASPLYPSAGIALAATLVFGPAALPGVFLGALLANGTLISARGGEFWPLEVLPLVIGLGATAQAWAGAALLRRFVQQPLVLNAPRDIVLAAALGVATLALWFAGVVPTGGVLGSWLTWWQGDTLGVLIGTPLVLTLVGQPAEDWRARRRTLGLPLLVVVMLLSGAIFQLARTDRQRAARAETQRMLRPPTAEAIRKAARRRDDQPRQQPARDARGQRYEQPRTEQLQAQVLHPQLPEVTDVAEHRHRDQPGKHDADQHGGAVRGLAPPRQLLQREDQPAERRVEGRRDAGRRTGHHQVVGIDAGTRRQPALRMEHHAGADLHRRPFASDRQAGQQTARDQSDLVHRQPQRDEARAPFLGQ